jgi:DnaJ domain
VNKDEAEKCRDIAVRALKQGQHDRAIKFFQKSLSLYPLPGVEAMLAQAESIASNGGNGAEAPGSASSSTSRPAPQRASSTASSAASSTTGGASGRAFTPAQEDIVKEILKAKEGGRGAHYRVLGVNTDASESDLKKAYRKLALKVRLQRTTPFSLQ